MLYENWPDLSHRRNCGCLACRNSDRMIDRLSNQSLGAALRHAQDRMEEALGLEAATHAGPVTLPGTFSGWKSSIELKALFNSPPAIFTRRRPPPGPGQGLLYRVYEENKQRPLYIGMAFRSSIQDRVRGHLAPFYNSAGKAAGATKVAKMAKAWGATAADQWRSEIAKLQAFVAANKLLKFVKVQFGEVEPPAGVPIDAKLTHAFEAALQVLERPHSYVGSARTFEADRIE